MSQKVKPWRYKTSRVLLEHARLRILEDDLELPDGQEISWLRYEKLRDFVVVVAYQEKQLVVIQHYNPPLKDYLCEFPCGMIDDGETVLDAAYRELLQETGLSASRLELVGQFLANPRRSNTRAYVVVATDLSQAAAALEPGEMIELERLELRQFEVRLRQGLEMSADALAAWSLARPHLPE